MTVPITAQSVNRVEDLDGIEWPITPVDYRKLGDALIDAVYNQYFCLDEPSGLSDIYALKLRDILLEIGFLSYSLFTYNRMLKAGCDFVADEQSVLLQAAKSRCYPSRPLFIPSFKRSYPRSIAGFIVDQASLAWGALFSFGGNPLCRQYIAGNGIAAYRLHWHHYSTLVDFPSSFEGIPGLANMGDALTAKVRGVWEASDLQISGDAVDYMRKCILWHFAIAYRDSRRSLGRSNMEGKTLLVGTGGKYGNRLLSYYFMRAGGRVVRFDHGGERALFRDRLWGFNEFAFQDVFVTFGEGLRKRLMEDISNREILLFPVEEKKIQIESIVYEGFRKIFNGFCDTKPAEIRKVMILMPVLSGSNNFPGFDTPDIFYLSIILKTIQALKLKGFYLILKQYPKLGMSRAFPLFDSMVDEIDHNYFDQVIDRADAFVCFYAGTAFCEALMSMKPVAYVHMPFRTVDPMVRSELEKILCWIDCEDNDGLFIDVEKMVSFLEDGDLDRNQREAFLHKYYLK